MKSRYLVAAMVLLALAAFGPVRAQNTVLRGENRSLYSVSTALVHLPAPVDNMFYYDGGLRLRIGDMRFVIPVEGAHFGSMQIDTAITQLSVDVDYAVTNPATKSVFFIERDSKGRTTLNELYDKDNGKKAERKVRLSGFSYTVDHPVFSADGKVMVFSSDCPLGFGGYDLWYSLLENDKWTYPQNMGPAVNTAADETMPAMYGNYMVFASSGRDGDYGGSDFYAARLACSTLSDGLLGGTLLTSGTVQSLDAPFCSPADERFMAFADGGLTVWYSSDSLHGDRLQAVTGRLDCVRLSGRLTKVDGSPVPDGMLVMAGDTVACDAEGNYCVYMQPDEEYGLHFYAPGCFTVHKTLTLRRASEDDLFYNDVCNITMFSYLLDTAYSFDDLFASAVSSELSMTGRSRLDYIARYLQDNPSYRISAASAYYGSADIAFCSLLNEARNAAVVDYLVGKGVSKKRITVPESAPRLADTDAVQTYFFAFSR